MPLFHTTPSEPGPRARSAGLPLTWSVKGRSRPSVAPGRHLLGEREHLRFFAWKPSHNRNLLDSSGLVYSFSPRFASRYVQMRHFTLQIRGLKLRPPRFTLRIRCLKCEAGRFMLGMRYLKRRQSRFTLDSPRTTLHLSRITPAPPRVKRAPALVGRALLFVTPAPPKVKRSRV